MRHARSMPVAFSSAPRWVRDLLPPQSNSKYDESGKKEARAYKAGACEESIGYSHTTVNAVQ